MNPRHVTQLWSPALLERKHAGRGRGGLPERLHHLPYTLCSSHHVLQAWERMAQQAEHVMPCQLGRAVQTAFRYSGQEKGFYFPSKLFNFKSGYKGRRDVTSSCILLCKS